MRHDSPFVLESATWPVLVVDESGVIRAASQGAASMFGAIVTSATEPLLASVWAPGNEGSVEQFLLKLERAPGGLNTVRLKAKGGLAARFTCFASPFIRDNQRYFTLQLFKEGTPTPDVGRGAGASQGVADAVRPVIPGSESAAAQKQKLDCALQLARTVALDFNNALTSILGHTSLLLSQIEPGHPWHNALMEVERSAEKAAEIAHDLGAFSRQEKDARSQVAGNLNVLVRRAAALFQKPGETFVQWRMELEPKLNAVQVDEAKMQQAFAKIFENSIQAMPEGGFIIVRSRNHHVAQVQHDESVELQPGNFVCVEIIDTGCGIGLDVLPRVFEPFFTTKPNPPHRGLGLAWVYGIMTNHGGHVAVSSHPGQGTAVRVYLPAQARVVWDEPSEDQELTGTARVLVVDDEELLLSMAQTVLSSFGYEVLTASSGEQALELFSADPSRIDLVITDLVMPKMGGRELMERLRAQVPGVRILCTSGYLRASGFEGNELYLQKPFTSQSLLRKVKQALTQPVSETEV